MGRWIAWLCWAEDKKTLAIGALLGRRREWPCHRTSQDIEKSPPPHVHSELKSRHLTGLRAAFYSF